MISKQAYIAQFLYENSARRRVPWGELESDIRDKWMAMASHAMVAISIWEDRKEKVAA